MNDLIISSLLGLLLFIVIFYYNNSSIKKTMNDNDNNNNEEVKDNAMNNTNDNDINNNDNNNNNETNEEKELRLKNKELLDKYLNESNDEDLIKKTQFLQKKFGISEDDIKKAIKQTRNELNNKTNSINIDESISIWKMIDWIIYIILIFGFCYFFNVSTKGDFGRVLAGMFPREFETLGLKKYLEKVNN